jgi:predicted DCC family thiol-disulfide oxidoreductase YuxK
MEDKRFELPILIYDSQCNLCQRFRDSLKKLPNTETINTISLHDDDLYSHFSELNKEECEQEVHYITIDKTILKGAEVVEHLIKKFPLVNRFAWLIESNMGKKAINYFNNMTNRYRKTLIKKCPSCMK